MRTPTPPGYDDPAPLDLADPRLHAEFDLQDTWRWLRRYRPVFWNEPRNAQPGFWVITRYSDVVAVLHDPVRFPSGNGNMLPSLLHGNDSGGGRMLPVTDDPRHREIRRTMSPGLGKDALRTIARAVTTAAARLVRDAAERGECDFVTDVAAPIPLAAICDLLDVAAGDRAEILRLTSSILADATPQEQHDDAVLARNELLRYFSSLTAARRARPAQDLVSRLAGAHDLSNEEAVLNCYALVLGGDETARLSIGAAARTFAENAAQWQSFRRGEPGLDSTVDELLRWRCPALHVARTAAEDVHIHGTRIRAGDIVTAWISSANFDAQEFQDPDDVDLGRRPNRHLTFGHGTHFCIGAQLSRIEIAAVVSALGKTVRDITLTGAPEPTYSNFLRGPKHLPVALTCG